MKKNIWTIFHLIVGAVIVTLSLIGLARAETGHPIAGYLEDGRAFVEPVPDHQTRRYKCPDGFIPRSVFERLLIILPNGKELPCKIVRPVCVAPGVRRQVQTAPPP